MTSHEFRQQAAAIAAAHHRGHSSNKYHACPTAGHASRREHRRATQLRLMLRAGQILDLREQVRFILIPTQRDPHGNIIERQCAYIADFVYRTPDGSTVVEDTKGVRTPQYIIKRKLMLAVHGLRITEI